MDERAILRFVNYKAPTAGRAKRLSTYLSQLTRTEVQYIAAHYMSPVNAVHSLRVIEARWKPKGARMFKQGILSFGASCAELEPSKALAVTKDVLGYFGSYPWLAAVHVNKPDHIHAHFLLGMTNVHTGVKYSQSPRELQQFREHYNQVARQNSLPTLNGVEEQNTLCRSEAITEASRHAVTMKGGDEDDEVLPWSCSPPPAMPMNAVALAPLVPNPLEVFGDRFRTDFAYYFNLGNMKG